jgi:hypothetical protein
VKFVKRISRLPGTGYADYIYEVDGVAGVCYQVTIKAYMGVIDGDYHGLKIEDLEKVREDKRAFGRRCARLASAAGVPWKVAILAGKIDDDEKAIRLLKAIRAARGKANIALKHELCCGIKRRTAGICQLIGGDTFSVISCKGQNATMTLAAYLAS